MIRSDSKAHRKLSVKEEMESSARNVGSPGAKSSHRDGAVSPQQQQQQRDKPTGAAKSSGALRKHGSSSSDHQQGLDTSQQKLSLKHVTLPSVNVILASMPASPVAAVQYLNCFFETAKKLKDEEKMKEIQRQLDYIKLYLRQA